MQNYQVKAYQKGFEPDQARIGQDVARTWIWPFAYDLDDLSAVHARPDFDADTRHYCFLGDEMVGYMFSIINPAQEGQPTSAVIDFPRMLPGHEPAAELLVERAFEVLKQKGVEQVTGRVTSMVSNDVVLAEKMGFSISDWGYKMYYAYEMDWGNISFPSDEVEEIDPERDLEACSRLASHWYRRPPEWCHTLLTEWHAHGIITHLGLREKGELIASCMAAPNTVRASTAAIYYIYSPDEHNLKPLLSKVVEKCIAFGTHNLIADLVNEQLSYEPAYQELGFKKVADWAHCIKHLS